MSERYKVTNENPNDAVGGGGCVCGDTKQADCEPPYVVFYASETDSNLSPHVVVCQRCVESAYAGTAAYEDRIVDVDGEPIDDEEGDIPLV